MSERPRVYKTEGVILRRRNIGEADSIFTVLTEREGKFEAVARGVRKARSRMRGHLEPLTHSRLMLARGRSLDVFTQAATIAPYRKVREDLERSALAMYCAELVDRFTVEHAEQPGVFDLLLGVLDALEVDAPAHVVRYFELHLLSLSGYDLQLDACALCGGRLAAEETLMSAEAGGLVCGGCRAAAGVGRLVPVAGIKVLRHARVVDLAAFAAVRVDEELGRVLAAALGDAVRYHLEREVSSSSYVAEVTRLSRGHPADEPGRVQ